ncbi:carboxymuconolactone decarboxylase family protein [Galbitalea soli]|uniref:Carboxymuconolactone decarboxylase family protein n=1 Tax=Galbitalea soli TaxID=1268042 RepID=A0A7C9PPD4_9MICO|nr:carboxymuconolactone decarboxylase family protein [Galbitalea soli]NEM92265.1 carboxymuconolactone decarboxylase family protein [Galbitalea soli]NYJ31779.1 4-carboxymuconolactone decarboxylase [Galbitalea soli]
MRVPALRPEQLDAAQTALYDSIARGPRAAGPQHFALTRDDGSLAGPFNAFLLSPEIGSAVQALGAGVRYATAFTARERELGILVVAAHWNSAFEQHAHESVARAAGLGEELLAELRAGRLPELDDPREHLVTRVAHALAHGDVDDALWADAAAQLGLPLLFELSTLVGYYALLALQLRVFRVDDADPLSRH